MIAFTQRIIRILAFFTTVLIALLYFNHQSIWYAIPVIGLSILWYRLGTKNNGLCQMGFLFVCILIALDVLENGLNLWGIFLIHTTVSHWDLATFLNRLQFIEITGDTDAIIHLHLTRLGYVIAIGMMLSFATYYLQTNIPLLGIMICGLILMIMLSRLVIRLRRDTA